MLISFRELLEERRSHGAAVGAFTCYNVETAIAVVQGAAARAAPAVLLVSEASFRRPTGPFLLPALAAVAERAPGGVCVQLDHVSDPNLMAQALESGAGAIMADGSRLPYRDNVRLVRDAVALAAPFGAHVEAELGHVEGGEDAAEAAAAGALTDPDEASSFAEETGAACLAVSIGNVHGEYASEPALDWPRLREIRARVDLPLSLHGASGLADADLRRAVSLGVAKVNVNTELRRRYLAELAARLPQVERGSRLLELDAGLVDALAEVVAGKIDRLTPERGGEERTS